MIPPDFFWGAETLEPYNRTLCRADQVGHSVENETCIGAVSFGGWGVLTDVSHDQCRSAMTYEYLYHNNETN